MNGAAVIYGAKSTEDKRGSIPTQLDDCRAMAEREGWKIVDQFTDEGFSAYSGNRGPGLREAEAVAVTTAAERGRCLLVAQHSDRLARGAGDAPDAADHLGELFFRLNRQGVTIYTVQEGEVDIARAFLSGMRNMEDSRRKSHAVAAGMRRRAERGQPNGGPRPYGYRYANGELEVVPGEAAIVRRIFREFVAGASITAITRGLERDRVQTVKGGRWQTTTVSGILRGVRYAGLRERDGERFPATHERIVEADTFRRAEELLSANTTSRPGRPPKGRHLFRRGLLRCECGGPMVPRTDHDREYYACHTRLKLGVDQCSQATLGRSGVDGAIFGYFATVGLDLEATRTQLAGERARKLAEIGALLDQAKREGLLASERLARIRQDYKDGRLPAADWIDLRDELTAEQRSADAEVERMTSAMADVERDDELADAEQDTLALLAEIRKEIAGEIQTAAGVDAVRAALSRLFSAFIVHPHWNPRYEGQGRSELVDVDQGHMIELQIRPAVLTGYSDRGMYPVLVREPLYQAENNQSVGFATR